jgi:hypothetical protein
MNGDEILTSPLMRLKIKTGHIQIQTRPLRSEQARTPFRMGTNHERESGVVYGPFRNGRSVGTLRGAKHSSPPTGRIGMTAPVFEKGLGPFSFRCRRRFPLFHPHLLATLAATSGAQREPLPRGFYRYRSKGAAQLCGYARPGFLPGHGFQFGDIICLPRSSRLGHTQHSRVKPLKSWI